MVVKHFPLRNHKYAQKAAQAALAADKQGKYWEFHRKLLENYRQLNDAKVEEIAKQLEMDLEKLKTDMESQEVKRQIAMDTSNGRQVGVRGTPTIFVNGKRLTMKRPGDLLKMVEAEIEKHKG